MPTRTPPRFPPGRSFGCEKRWVTVSVLKALVEALLPEKAGQWLEWCCRGLGLTLGIEPGFDTRRPKAKQMAKLDCSWNVAAQGMTAVDSLLSQANVGRERLGREEMLHGSLH